MTNQLETTPVNSPEELVRAHLESNVPPIGEADYQFHQRLLAELRHHHQQPLQPQSQDPVLKVLLKSFGNGEISNNLVSHAVQKLEATIGSYKRLLGHFLPDWLVQEAESRIETKAYEDGSNANAALDWDVFSKRLLDSPSSNYKFSTGIACVDNDLNGGIDGFTILLGDKGVGKTAFVINSLATAIQNPQTAVLFYSLDMPKDEIYSRIACREFNVPFRGLREHLLNLPDGCPVVESMTTKLQRLRVIERDYSAGGPSYDNDFDSRGMSHNSIMEDARKLANDTRAEQLLIVVDLFQKILVPSSVPVSEEDVYRLDVFNQLNQKLRRYFGGNKFAFLVTSEMRKREGRKTSVRPTIDDIKGDGRISSDAGCILILSTTDTVDAERNEVLLDIAKGREGVVRGTHDILFHHSRGRFEAIDRDQNPGNSDSPSQIDYEEE